MSQTFRDQQRADILPARSQDTARTAEVAARRSFGAGTAGTVDFLQIEAASSNDLSKPERRFVPKLTLRGALRPVSFGGVEPDEPKRLASDADRVAVQKNQSDRG
jgi:hypothetical protein